ncbi:MAG: argininosuccinate synthase [Dehalococcoidia bacterium]|nr:argininosuccinate synthase [Dehalococcoidia bacterium]
MLKKLLLPVFSILVLLSILTVQLFLASPALAAGATTEVHIVKYAHDGVTVIAEKTVTYEWMKANLHVYGDGNIHYYHQGPIFEGDLWDPDEINNLKDKGAVQGSSVKDLCDTVGGMSPGDEVMMVAVDAWHTEFAYSNIYEPLDRQGIIALCWFNGEDALIGERYGEGYPAKNGYSTALQIVFMAGTPNPEGKYVFGNTDMKMALPEEKYQHFYEGLYPSTNGLSGKWIKEIRIYSGGIDPNLKIELKSDSASAGDDDDDDSTPWIPIVLGVVGLTFIGVTGYVWIKGRKEA